MQMQYSIISLILYMLLEHKTSHDQLKVCIILLYACVASQVLVAMTNDRLVRVELV